MTTQNTYDGDEEEERRKNTPGKPNAYWARVKEQQDRETHADQDNFTGSYRGVPTPHPGAQAVRPDDTIGQEDLCWCGQPLGHDWPGKPRAPHPVEGDMATPTLNRRDLRAYHARLQDFIIQCVNDDGLRYRTGKNSTILYPPDGSQPMSVYARNSDRQVATLHKWYLDHVYPHLPKEEGQVDANRIAALAKAKNDPKEHPVEEKKEEPQPEPEPVPVAPTLHTGPVDPDRWVPYVNDAGQTDEYIETNGPLIRCRLCLGTDHPLLSENKRSIGGHKRMHHGDRSTIHGPEARARAGDTVRYNHVRERMVEVLVPLLESVGWKPEPEEDPVKIKELLSEKRVLQGEITRLQKELQAKENQLTEVNERADDAEARLALMREALRA